MVEQRIKCSSGAYTDTYIYNKNTSLNFGWRHLEDLIDLLSTGSICI